MIVFTSGNWRVDKASIPQTPGSSRMQFFVDDKTGKNWRVFNTLEECKVWIVDKQFSLKEDTP